MSKALLQYLNTPPLLRNVNKSPAQLATGRQLQGGVSVARQHYTVEPAQGEDPKTKGTSNGEGPGGITPNERRGTTLSVTLGPGMSLRVQDAGTKLLDKTGIVTEARPYRQKDWSETPARLGQRPDLHPQQ